MPTDNPLDYLYPEDPTGQASSNLIENEVVVITPPVEVGDYNIIFPKMSPYFLDSMMLIHSATGRELTRGVDWSPGHQFLSASYELEWVRGGVFGSILVKDPTLLGQFVLREYQTLGGGWNLDPQKILEILANRAVDPRIASFEQVSGLPNVYPPRPHSHPADDFIGYADFVLKQGDIEQAIRDQTQAWLDNPPLLMGDYVLRNEAESIVRQIVDSEVQPELTQQINAVSAQVANLQSFAQTGFNDRYTKTESDARYSALGSSYTKSESDTRYYTKPETFTRTESDSRYYLKTQTYTRAEMDNRYLQPGNIPNANASTVGGVKARLSGTTLFLTFNGNNA